MRCSNKSNNCSRLRTKTKVSSEKILNKCDRYVVICPINLHTCQNYIAAFLSLTIIEI